MAIANGRPRTPALSGRHVSPDEKLEQISALLDDQSPVTAAMLKIKIWAICEGVDISASRRAFLPLAKRAGLRQRAAYNTWAREFRAEPSGPVVRRLGGRNLEAQWIVTPELALLPATVRPMPQMALYRWRDECDLLLYIGISDDFTGRSSSHYSKGSIWMEFAVTATIERYPTRAAALDAEEAAIKAEHPIFNKQHNDTPEARQRQVGYLIEHDRLDLLAPAASRG